MTGTAVRIFNVERIKRGDGVWDVSIEFRSQDDRQIPMHLTLTAEQAVTLALLLVLKAGKVSDDTPLPPANN